MHRLHRRVTQAVSGKTNYLVAGLDSGDTKLGKAKQLGIPIVGEDEFLELIRTRPGKGPPQPPTTPKKVLPELLKQSPSKIGLSHTSSVSPAIKIEALSPATTASTRASSHESNPKLYKHLIFVHGM